MKSSACLEDVLDVVRVLAWSSCGSSNRASESVATEAFFALVPEPSSFPGSFPGKGSLCKSHRIRALIVIILLNTDHTGPVVSLGRNSGCVLIVHLAVQFQAACSGPRVRVIVPKRVK